MLRETERHFRNAPVPRIIYERSVERPEMKLNVGKSELLVVKRGSGERAQTRVEMKRQHNRKGRKI